MTRDCSRLPMTMFMYHNAVAITNRHLCPKDYFGQIEKILSCRPKAVILREKDLPETEYEEVAKKVLSLVEGTDLCGETELIFHYYPQVARRLNYKKIHLPMPVFVREDLSDFIVRGVSIHSVEEACKAEKLGATYLTASHIYETDCKKGVPPKGIEFLKEVVESVHIPVYALGGITKSRTEEVMSAGAAGYCMMSEFMTGL